MNPDRHARVKRVFLAAVVLPEKDREAYLDRECGADMELRGQVMSLLAYHDPHTILADAPAAARRPDVGDIPRMLAGRRELDVPRSRGLAGLPVSVPIVLGALGTALMLALLGYWLHTGIKTSLREMRASKLEGLRDAQIAALRQWMELQRSKAQSWARNPTFVGAVEQLLKIDTDAPTVREDLLDAPQQQLIRDMLQAMAGQSLIYAVWNRSGTMIANDLPNAEGLGERIAATGGSTLLRVLDGETVVRKPYEKNAVVKSARLRAENPLIAVITPIRNARGTTIGVLGLADAEAGDKFSEILSIARTGRSGETYAFDEDGTMLSESRFNDQLKQLGMIPDRPDARSSLNVRARDPGGDLTAGYRAELVPAARPLTTMARLATAGQDGVDVDGYRDYRGVKVIGAWRWLPQEGFGVATEIDFDEAYLPLAYLETAFRVLFAVLVVSAGAGFVALFWVGRLKTQVGEALRLGQYTLEEKIGEGGIGVVYKARHAMLKRPTAIKLLKPDLVNDETLARFEREVQLASQLTHPNTIEIYDYGRTPDGVFYCAMEFLPGLSLAQLIAMEGAVFWPRAVFILKQICLSLREAHGLGLVHRDIKPLNVMLCQRGGDSDVVKVLDFGLVKYVDTPADADITAIGILTGTPQYIAPERLDDPRCLDTRSDLYALGALGYKLLTGEDVFPGCRNVEVLHRVLHTAPDRPSARTRTDFPPELDQLIVDCLAKEPDRRPQDVHQILETLAVVDRVQRWTQDDARAWWQENNARL